MRPSGRQGCSSPAGDLLTTAALASLLTASVLMAALTGCGEQAGTGPYGGLFPEPGDVEHVTGAGEMTEYRDETLYDFLNGGAELYFDYDIVAVASREYRLPEDSGIEVSVYDMGRPRNAFGIYSIFRYAGADHAEIGNEAIVTPTTLDFWKGDYYCKLFAFGPSEATGDVMLALGRAVAQRISEAGSRPALLGLLPGEAMRRGSEKYFHRHLALNNIRYVDSENVLSLGSGTEGVTAEYRTGQSEYTGYIVRYPSSAEAETAFRDYSDFLGQEAEEVSRNGVKMFILEEGPIEAIALAGSHIVGVWDADTSDLDFIHSVEASLAGEE